ncbi:hypothetical protein C9374_005028 [Naegleria lovaniensis]|uniref:Timeless N-terminal domain-containing protein n=1 Tax=Naegleria lovaniensis TaxID=51637 RepID=A0AA88GQ15_NAELO|nr:uncharacterized protein C9374_005028 [Naegleria lovaniensis]KAG2382448.1 hypothetical protein C9374_005028 [Naegleria lovaniensis]
MDFEDELEYQFESGNTRTDTDDAIPHDDGRVFDHVANDDDDDGVDISKERFAEEEAHFDSDVKPHLIDIIQQFTNFIVFKDDAELSFEENTEIYASKRKLCIETMQDLQEILKEDITKRERRVWTFIIESNVYKNELFSLLAHHRKDFEIVREVVDVLVLLSKSPDQNNPRFRKFQARGGAAERHRATFYFAKQMKLLQRLKQGILEQKFIPLIVWSLMDMENEMNSKHATKSDKKRRGLGDEEVYAMTIFKLFNNFLSIPDAKHERVLQTEELQTRMQDVFIKQLQNDCQFLDYAVATFAKYVEKFDDVPSQSVMKKLSEFQLVLLKFATMICWNETAQDLFSSSMTIPSSTTATEEIVMSQNEENMEKDNSELKRLLRREKIYKDQVKSLILTSRHTRFQGTLLERSSNVSKIIDKNKSILTFDADDEAEKENKKNDVKIQKTFVVPNVSQLNTANMYSVSDNPFLVGGGQQKAASTIGARFGARRINVTSDKMELRFSSSSLDTKRIVKTFADNLYRSCFNQFVELALKAIWKQQDESIAIRNELDQKSSKEALDHESERNLLYLCQFMLSFNRHKYLQKKRREEEKQYPDTVHFDISLVSNLLKQNMISMIFQKLLSEYFFIQHHFNLTFVIAFLRELFMTFRWMGDRDHSGSNSITWGRIVSIHLHHILYDPTNMEGIIRLIREYKPYQNSTKYLSQLVLFVDLFVTVIEENLTIESFFMRKKGVDNSNDDEDDNRQEDDTTNQKRFELESLRRKFAHPSVLKQYMYLFRFYDINSPEVNKCIIKTFKYLIEELNMELLMFRASFLKLCFNILSNKTFLTETSTSFEKKVNEEVVDFVLSLVKNFFKRVDEDPFTICESLHWSTMGEVSLLNNADMYSSNGFSSSRTRTMKRTDETLGGFITREDDNNNSGEEEYPLTSIHNDEESSQQIPSEEEQQEKKPKKKKKSTKRKKRSEEGDNQNTEEKPKKKKKKKKKKVQQEEEPQEVEEEEEQPTEEVQAQEEQYVEEEEEEKLLLSSSESSDDESRKSRLKRLTKKRVSFAPSTQISVGEEFSL